MTTARTYSQTHFFLLSVRFYCIHIIRLGCNNCLGKCINESGTTKVIVMGSNLVPFFFRPSIRTEPFNQDSQRMHLIYQTLPQHILIQQLNGSVNWTRFQLFKRVRACALSNTHTPIKINKHCDVQPSEISQSRQRDNEQTIKKKRENRTLS